MLSSFVDLAVFLGGGRGEGQIYLYGREHAREKCIELFPAGVHAVDQWQDYVLSRSLVKGGLDTRAA
jgi:hypothetical protein